RQPQDQESVHILIIFSPLAAPSPGGAGAASGGEREVLVCGSVPGADALVLTRNVCSEQSGSSGGMFLPCQPFSRSNAPRPSGDGSQGCTAHSPPGWVQSPARVPAPAIPERPAWIASSMPRVPSPGLRAPLPHP